jgi:L-threonylcarbamoyladenylate synthase
MPQVSIAALVVAARSGKLVCFPTDTVPAIATIPPAAAVIFEAKQRQADKPLILMAATAAALWPYVKGTVEDFAQWRLIVQQFWPGALTLVLPASEGVPPSMNPVAPTTIGIRVPHWSIAQMILEQTGPLATTSLNRSGQPPLEDLEAIAREFPEVYYPPASYWQLPPPNARLPSTVARWESGAWTILRQGAIQLSC